MAEVESWIRAKCWTETIDGKLVQGNNDSDEDLRLPGRGQWPIYRDEQASQLDAAYDIARFRGAVLSSLGLHERERVAAILLAMGRREGHVIGVRRTDLEQLAATMSCAQHYAWGTDINEIVLETFVEEGWVRPEESSAGTVLYPTAALLEKQYVPKRAE